ncbi:MAG TPA: hypothetical protein VEV84_15750 [Pyrinomonadaceae bacterium]|jgi:hypothetical protein|nr:hypothetical protein [Pyrinomonadaceae bacterium]
MFFTSDNEVTELASSFYSRALPLSKWDASTQLTVTLYFALRFPYRMAADFLRERVMAFSANAYRSDEEASKLDAAIHHWLHTAIVFAKDYQNIEDLSALANIFIAKHWKTEAPYDTVLDMAFLDADTARFTVPEGMEGEMLIA